MGEFTSKIKTLEDFEIIRQDIILNLSNYLKSVETSFDLSKINAHELSIFLCSPQLELRNGDKVVFDKLIDSLKHEVSHVEIISFNYTSILDNLIQSFIGKTMTVPKAINKQSVIRKVKHIHGFLDERMIIGVNDDLQVSNKEFIKDMDFNES